MPPYIDVEEEIMSSIIEIMLAINNRRVYLMA